jgi:hypothetical protein
MKAGKAVHATRNGRAPRTVPSTIPPVVPTAPAAVGDVLGGLQILINGLLELAKRVTCQLVGGAGALGLALKYTSMPLGVADYLIALALFGVGALLGGGLDDWRREWAEARSRRLEKQRADEEAAYMAERDARYLRSETEVPRLEGGEHPVEQQQRRIADKVPGPRIGAGVVRVNPHAAEAEGRDVHGSEPEEAVPPATPQLHPEREGSVLTASKG